MPSRLGGHKKRLPGRWEPRPCLPGGLLASEVGSSSLGEGRPRLLSGDVGVAGLAGAWMGVRPLPQLTRLSQGMRPLRQRTLTPSESRLPRQKEVSQAAQKLKQCSHRGPSPGRVPAVRGGSLAMATLQDNGSRERAIPHTRSRLSTTPAGARSRAPRTHPRGRLPPRLHGQLSWGSGPWPCAAGSESGLWSL